MSFMLSVANKPTMLSVIMLNIVMLNVVAPNNDLKKFVIRFANSNPTVRAASQILIIVPGMEVGSGKISLIRTVSTDERTS
jgi:hypothetical protein